MVEPARRALGERAPLTPVVTHMKDRHAPGASALQHRSDPTHDGLSLVRLERRREQALLDVDEKQCGRHVNFPTPAQVHQDRAFRTPAQMRSKFHIGVMAQTG